MNTAKSVAEPIECEIKLTGSKGALRAAEAAVRRVVGSQLQWQTVALVTDYYDTADRRLSQRGVAFRVRKKDRAFEQTVKAKTLRAAALSSRPEWNIPLPSAKPDLDALPAAATARMGLVLPGELRKLFTVDVSRKKAVVDIESASGAATVEIAVDRGVVRTGRRRDDISEVEIELIEGAPAAIYDLAIALVDSGLRVSRVTKAERGYGLVDGRVASLPKKAPKLVLTRQQTVSGALAEIFGGGIVNVLENEAAAIDGTDPEGVHQLRVSLRRMRSALSVFRTMLDPASIVWASAELKWLASCFGPARDWDVFGTEILDSVQGYGIDVAAIDALRGGSAAARADGYAAARAALQSSRYTKLILGMSRFVDTHGWMPADAGTGHPLNQPLGKCADTILERAYTKVMKRGRGLKHMEIAARHQVRIELKKFRYTTEFLHALYDADKVGAFMKSLSRMQDQFGHLNDVSVARTLLGELLDAKGLSAPERRICAFGAGQVIGWHARGVSEAESAFLDDWKALKAAPVFWHPGKGS